MNHIVRVQGLMKSFGANAVLAGVDLDIPEGQITSIVGQSGMGKSVLIKTVMGLVSPDAGRIWFRDEEMTGRSRHELERMRRHFGYSFQNAALFDSMTVAENIAFPLDEALGIKDRDEIRARVSELLDWIELSGIGDMRPDELSGGMRKRVGVARALAARPEILIFDEPTTGLDPVLSETINNLVVRVNRELSVTCVLITHDIPAAFRISDKIAFLDSGHIVAEGSPGEVAASDHPLVRDFIRTAFSELKP